MFDDLSDIIGPEVDPVERGRQIVEGDLECVTNCDMHAYRQHWQNRRAEAIASLGCCGDEPDEFGQCRMRMCPLVVEAQQLVREMENVK